MPPETLDNERNVRAWLASSVGCDEAAVTKLAKLVELLRDENLRQNLVSAGSMDSVWVRHIADSAQLLGYVPRETKSPWLDLGTGAGFPGLVIAVCRPDIEVLMVESRVKRIEWLERVVDALHLTNARVLGQRLDTVRDRAVTVISARAFARLGQLIALATRFSTPETLWLLPKGRSARQERAEMPKSIQEMFHVEQSLTDREAAILVGRGRPPSLTGRRA